VSKPPLSEFRRAQLLIWAAKLDDLMAERQISQAKLARLMDTAPSTICDLLQGKDAYASTYFAAFAALGVEVEIKSLS